jgi:putative membrane protein
MNPTDQERQQERQPGPAGHGQEPDYRFTLANERTFLAWIRTALALIAGGVAVIQLVPAFGIPGVRHVLSVLLTAGGGLLAASAVRRWQRVQAAMRRDADLPPTWLPILLGGALLTVTILVVVVVLLVPTPSGS